MATLTGLAPIIRSTIASLQTGMAAQIAAFNNDSANSVQLDAPATYLFGITDVRSAVQMPLVEVVIRDWTMDIVDIGLNMDVDPELIVICWQEGASGDVPEAYEASMGLSKCALEVLMQDNAFGPTVGRLDSRDGARTVGACRMFPADLSSDRRTVTKWHVGTELRFTLPGRDGLA